MADAWWVGLDRAAFRLEQARRELAMDGKVTVYPPQCDAAYDRRHDPRDFAPKPKSVES